MSMKDLCWIYYNRLVKWKESLKFCVLKASGEILGLHFLTDIMKLLLDLNDYNCGTLLGYISDEIKHD